ncbi:hypothetical protein PMIT1320_00922 [Prochlorococcus marinus str. MIT 1320]|nr:hypothetical protein PMIT1320_00922 [Prochlorococcus marinus str. MIT 1320]
MIRTGLWNDALYGFIANPLLPDQCLYSPLIAGVLFIFSVELSMYNRDTEY